VPAAADQTHGHGLRLPFPNPVTSVAPHCRDDDGLTLSRLQPGPSCPPASLSRTDHKTSLARPREPLPLSNYWSIVACPSLSPSFATVRRKSALMVDRAPPSALSQKPRDLMDGADQEREFYR
jgi:hypothetical protein